jgi:hypothetical protein
MVEDWYEIFKRVWAIIGPLFGGKDAPAGFWLHLRVQLGALWKQLEPLWAGTIDDAMSFENRCRHAGVLFAGLAFTIGVWRCDRQAVKESCSCCGRALNTRWLRREFKTTCGPAPAFRREVRCKCGHLGRHFPADRALGFAKDARVSPGLRYWACKWGSTMVYAHAEESLTSWTGQCVLTAQGIHEQCQLVGRALSESPRVAPATTIHTLPGRIVLDADAAVVGMHHTAKHEKGAVERFELWTGRVYESFDAECGGKIRFYRHLAFGGGCSRAGDDVAMGFFTLARQRFPHAIPHTTVYVRGDGGALLDTIAKLFPKHRRLLDLYHTLVKISERVKEGFPDMPRRVRHAIGDGLAALLRKGDGEDLVKECVELAQAHPACADAMARLAKHIDRHKDHIWYPEAKALGLGVGTGIAEKDVDLLLDRRFELRGMSWTPTGARNALRIRLTLYNETLPTLEDACRQRQPNRSV